MSKFRPRLRELWEDYRFEIIVIIVALLACILGFLLGYLTARESPAPIIIEQSSEDGGHYSEDGGHYNASVR